ncbi:hypothetical protein ACFC1R_23625 [Kitasatospora sp. NPDC056138]|uniref:hypothetical protein n=1 Tax=Kitasatospora sp. NPDC056138 TaxID=3345724 RepID=UPI0035DF4E50
MEATRHYLRQAADGLQTAVQNTSPLPNRLRVAHGRSSIAGLSLTQRLAETSTSAPSPATRPARGL